MTTRRVARVLIDSPLPQLDRLFDYEVPDELVSAVTPGVRVRVPLRTAGRLVDAYVIEVDEADAAGRPLSRVDSVISTVAVLPPGLYALARRAADRAAGSASDILRLAIPKRMVRAEKTWLAAGPVTAPVVADADVAWSADVLATFPGLAEALLDGERLALDAPPHPVTLASGETVGAWAQLLAAAAVRTLAAGRSAVLVVPDHRDQGQLEQALAARVPAGALVRDDARRSGPERYASYLRVLTDQPCIVVGNRSTVYAPVHAPGLVAIWDDGDPLLAEPLSPGVHARDAALVRQELDGAALLFAGHTRTTDAERLVAIGWVRDVPARRRTSPRVVLSATREGEAQGARVPSSAFAAAREGLAAGPVLVQVSRPGYAPVLVCADCRTPARCPHCPGPLRARRPGAVPECAVCGRNAPAWKCANCESTRLRMASAGSERTADELGRAFPNTRVIVADGVHPVTHVDAKPALVIATRGAEPIAAGGYRAVVLLDGDRMLMADDLRIGESCLRWWSNAAALAAPGAPVHLVSVTGAVARALATWTQAAYARTELAERAPLHMPPVVRVATVDGSTEAVRTCLDTLRADVPTLTDEAILGPVSTEAGARAVVRFDYGLGRAVAESLRSAVVADALRARRSAKGRPGPARATLRVRVDVPDLDL
ncbi:primosomal protein N' [Microbacterium sp. zg.Y1084]|uniref:primosomal protein N' family DNA-binding protein n=1 Tax=Microbacterium sp. zg.Y1084 TaxID=2969667 RepID=UPI00214CDB5F|nr:primosomal protein N' [Microbacterium sp. zg.Y1084]MCR2811909.1 primosomal protein N' [Microbacterium sp. zg.Y1084]